ARKAFPESASVQAILIGRPLPRMSNMTPFSAEVKWKPRPVVSTIIGDPRVHVQVSESHSSPPGQRSPAQQPLPMVTVVCSVHSVGMFVQVAFMLSDETHEIVV